MKYVFLLSLSLFFIQCTDDTADIPSCIQSISDEFQIDACEGSGDLTLWNFNGQEVYCFNYGTCIFDSAAEIYDEDCKQLCLIGGLIGNTLCLGLEWSTNATLVETIYTY